MNLLTCIFTENRCYKTGATIKPKGVMVHSTGANNPNLRRYVQPVSTTPDRAGLLARLGTNPNGNHWNRAGLSVCVHGFIGKLADGSVAAVQTLPWDRRGWHAGNGSSGRSANDTHISFEICEDGLDDPDYFARAYREAVELTAMLCKQYGLDPLADGVVISHREGCATRRGTAGALPPTTGMCSTGSPGSARAWTISGRTWRRSWAGGRRLRRWTEAMTGTTRRRTAWFTMSGWGMWRTATRPPFGS